jgi:hypothetical protein
MAPPNPKPSIDVSESRRDLETGEHGLVNAGAAQILEGERLSFNQNHGSRSGLPERCTCSADLADEATRPGSDRFGRNRVGAAKSGPLGRSCGILA